MVFIVLPYKPVAIQIYLEPQRTPKFGLCHCIIDYKAKTPDDAKTQREFMTHDTQSFSFQLLLPLLHPYHIEVSHISSVHVCGRTMDYDFWIVHQRSQWWIQYGKFYIVRADRGGNGGSCVALASDGGGVTRRGGG